MNERQWSIPVFAVAVALVFGAAAQAQPRVEAVPVVAPFSSGKIGPAPQAPWKNYLFGAQKTPTEYGIVEEDGKRVLHAKAVSAASAIVQEVKFDINSAPVVEWQWKVRGLIPEADNAVASKEDSPARLFFAFDGDKSKLSAADRTRFFFSKGATGQEAPYAMLIYVWSNKEPVGKVIQNPNTSRVQMVVASTGAAGVGKWQTLSRNVRDDYKKAYGEDPGPLIGVGVFTDTDNTGGTAEAWYGDIRFLPTPP
jgi:hypothetical protein